MAQILNVFGSPRSTVNSQYLSATLARMQEQATRSIVTSLVAEVPEGPVGVIYSRYSKALDTETATARQTADCIERASRDCVTALAVYQDRISGRKDVVRPAFDAAVKWVTAGPDRTLYVWKLDRLTRRGMGHMGNILDALEAAHSRIVFLSDGFDSSQPGNRMVLGILAEQARQESDNTALRVTRALADRRERGLWMGGRPPFGWLLACAAIPPNVKLPGNYVVTDAVQPGQLVLDPVRAPILRSVIDDVIKGKSLRAVCQDLGEAGVLPARGKEWSVASLGGMLRSPVLVGHMPAKNGATNAYRDAKGEPVVVGEPLIGFGRRRLLIEALDKRSVMHWGTGRRRSVGRGKGTTLLAGRIRCSCGATYVKGGKTSNPSYICANNSSGGRCTGGAVSMRAADDEVTSQFLNWLAAKEDEDPILGAVAKAIIQSVPDAEAEAKRTVLTSKASDIEAQMADLEEARYVRNEFKGEKAERRYEMLYGTLRERLLVLEAQIEALPRPANESPLLDLEELRRTWSDLSMDRRQDVLAVGIRQVLVARAHRKGGPFDRRRIRIEWVDAVTG